MDLEESKRIESNSMSLYAAVSVVDTIINKGAQVLYDQYLDSILPPHELQIVVSS